MARIDRDEVTCTKADLETVRRLRDMTKTATHPGVMTLKNAESFPELFGASREGGAVHPDGEYWYSKERTMRFVRAKLRYFVGSELFPDGLIVGTTDIETHRIEGGNEWNVRNSQEDISPEEMQRLEAMVRGEQYISQQSHIEIAKKNEKQRRAGRAAQADPLGTAIAAGIAAAQATAAEATKQQRRSAKETVPA